MKCASCGAVNPQGKRFCADCGSPLSALCPACGSANDPNKRFCGDCGQALIASAAGSAQTASPAPLAPPASPIAPVARAAPAAERRQLTVMFADLVGSSALSNRLDPEVMRAVLRSFHAAVTGAVAPFEGFVAQLLGDGVLVYFGYPRAHEDDASRAVHAALAVLRALAGVPAAGSTEPLQTRIGIATGLVVIGQIGEGTAASEQSASGETPNLAARMQALAAPGQIVLSDATRQLLDASFELDALGAQSLKGFDAPVPAWRVAAERALASRFEAQHQRANGVLIGRDSEVALLLDRWALAREGEAQVIVLSGEAGIGKSRIGQALRERLAGEEHAAIVLQCSPYFSGSALYPVVQHLRLAAGIVNADSAEQQRQKVNQLSAALAPERQRAVLRLLGLDEQELSAEEAQMAQQHKARTLDALVDLMGRLAQTQPVCLWVEDAHWIDPTTQELLVLLVDRLRDARLLSLVTTRPDATLNLGKPAHLTTLTLNRLGQRQCAALIDAVAQGRSVPPEVRAEIIRKTDGVPLFVEELTKTVLNSGLLEQARAAERLNQPLPDLAIPSTLQDSLMARLDRLNHAKEVAQAGAAIGREFTRALLGAVMEDTATQQLDKALAELEAADLLIWRGEGERASYTFKHALVRDTAYNSMLKAQRALRHGQIAAAIERSEPDAERTRPELLAHHYQEAGDAQRASELWAQAGRLAVTRGANREAVAAFERALALLDGMAQTVQTDTDALDIRIALGPALIGLRGPWSPEVETSYREAQLRAERLGDRSGMFQAHWGLNYTQFMAGRYTEAVEVARRLLELASHDDDGSEQVEAHHALWGALVFSGRPLEALAYLERGRGLYEPDRHAYLRYRYAGHDVGVCCSALGAEANWLAGFPERARRELADFRTRMDQINHSATNIMLAHAAWVHYLLGEYESAAAMEAELMVAATKHGFAAWAEPVLVLAELVAEAPTVPARLYGLKERVMGGKSSTSLKLMMGAVLTELCVAAGEIELAQDVLTPLPTVRDWMGRAELIRLEGVLRLGGTVPDPAAAERSFESALQVGREQGAKSFELRAATSLASLWNEQGKRREAQELLGGVYGWFTEGFDTPDLRRAKALLDEWARA